MQKPTNSCRHCRSDCNLITYLPTLTSAEFRWTKIIPKTFTLSTSQPLWLPEHELESVLQHEHNLDGNVATKHPGNLREWHHQLYRPAVGANETEVSQQNGWRGAYHFAHWGFPVTVHVMGSWFFHRETSCTMLMKKILQSWTSFLASQQSLVSC